MTEFDYAVREWSEKHGKEIGVANFSVSEDGLVTLEANADYARLLSDHGISPVAFGADGAARFEINAHEVPSEVLAIALGLPGQDPKFRAELLGNGYAPAAFVMTMALEGHPMQSGRVVTTSYDYDTMTIDASKIISADDTVSSIPKLPGILGMEHQYEPDLLVQNVLVRRGEVLMPCYVVTSSTDIPAQNLPDRLALMTAYLQEVGSIEGVVADKPIKVGVLDNGNPYMIFTDSMRKNINIRNVKRSEISPQKILYEVATSDAMARKGISSMPGLKHSHSDFSKHFQIGVLTQVVEDRLREAPPVIYSAKESGAFFCKCPRIWSGMSIEVVSATKILFETKAEQILTLSQKINGSEVQGEPQLVEAVGKRLERIIHNAYDYKMEIETRMDMAKTVMQRPQPRYDTSMQP